MSVALPDIEQTLNFIILFLALYYNLTEQAELEAQKNRPLLEEREVRIAVKALAFNG